MAVTLTSTTQSDSEMQEALALPRYNLNVEPAPTTPTEPAAPAEPSEPPAEPVAEGKTVADPEPAKPTQELTDEEKAEIVSAEEQRVPLPRGVQRKIDRLTRQRGEEKGKREAAEARAKDLEDRLAAATPKPTPPAEPEPVAPQAEVKPAAPEPKPKPKAEDFPENYEDYIEALVDWKADQKVAVVVAEADKKIVALETKLATATSAKEQAAVADEIWSAKVEKAKAELPDFDAVMASEAAKKMQVSPVMQSAILDHDKGPAIGHYLATHPDVADRIFKATALTDKSTQVEIQKAIMTVGREFGRIEDLLAKPVETPPPAAAAPVPPAPEKPQPVQPPVSSAPRPITPVGTRSATSVTTEPPTDASEYLRWREAEMKKRAG